MTTNQIIAEFERVLGPADKAKAAQDACDAWGAELRKSFGKRAGDMRYLPAGKGEPGSDLRRTYDAFVAARIARWGQ
jgi:hypothetical protein